MRQGSDQAGLGAEVLGVHLGIAEVREGVCC